MPSWNDLIDTFNAQVDDQAKMAWLNTQRNAYFSALSAHMNGRNVLYYGSAFLQKSVSPAALSIMHEDINGFMSVVYGMDCDQGLTLILHTPGGNPNAAQTIVEYLRSKFASIDVIVPAFAMSAGTMISLACDKIIMGRQSQLGPIDPQLTLGGRTMSARGVVDQFARAHGEILANPTAAHVWAPITQSLGPALLQDAQNALDYSEQMVADWLSRYMFSGEADAASRAALVASHFNDATTHKSHGRRIDFAEVAAQKLNAARLEDDQVLQELVLSIYHLITIIFDQSAVLKLMATSNGRVWLKNQNTPSP